MIDAHFHVWRLALVPPEAHDPVFTTSARRAYRLPAHQP